MAKRRLSRHELREPDQVITTAEKAYRIIVANRRQAAAVAGLIVLAGLAYLGAQWWRTNRSIAANAEVTELLRIAARPVATASAATLDGAEGDETFADQRAKDDALLGAVGELDKKGPAVIARRAAAMLKGRSLMHRGEYTDAARVFGEVHGRVVQDALGASALLARMDALAAAGESDEAITELKRLAGDVNPYLAKEVALEKAAELAEKADLTAESVALYERLAAEASDERVKQRAETRLDELRPRLEVGTATSSGGRTESP